MADKFQTPNINSEEITKIKFENPTRKINLIFFLYAVIIMISNIIYKLLWTKNSNFTKHSNLTGIKIIRNNLFAIPFFLTVVNFLVSFIVFNYYLKSKYKENMFNNSYLNFLRKFKFFHLFKNLLLTLFCYIIYSFLYLPIQNELQFRLSGHVLVTYFTSAIMINMSIIINEIINNKIATRTFKLFNYIIYFSVFHSGYCLIFTSSIFHFLSECVISLIISVIYINLLNFLPVNLVVRQLINPKLPKSKVENIISFSN